MKGQYITVENVFFFGMGVAMCILVFIAYTSISDSVRAEIMKDQIERVGRIIQANIVSVYLAGNQTNSSVTMKLEIPAEISGCIYQITLATANPDMLKLNCTDNNIGTALNLYGIDTTIKNKVLFSSKGEVEIIYQNCRVELN